MGIKLIRSIAICLFLCLTVSSIAEAAPSSQTIGNILYVKQTVSGLADCSTWENACGLQDALDVANSGDQIWVAAGTYYPSSTLNREATFQLKSGVAIYGGFPETGGEWIERNWSINVTTLSGDIGTTGNKTDNSYHVVTARVVAASTILDGFTITAGNANYSSGEGGGLFITDGSPTFSNLIISGNFAYTHGGGISNRGEPMLTDVTIFGNNVTNLSSGAGGGIYNYFGDPTLTNVAIFANTAIYGGGIHNHSSDPILKNVTLNNNSALYGGGFYNFNSCPILTNVTFSGNGTVEIYNYNDSNPTLVNSIVWGELYQIYNDSSSFFPDSTATINYSDIKGGYPGTGNINSDPKLSSLADNGGFSKTMALAVGSPAIDKGDPASCPIFDQRGYPRPIDGDAVSGAICDMGAYEYASAPASYTLTVDKVGSGSVTPPPDEAGYLYGQPVTLTATADPGYTFAGWSGDATGMTNPLNITILRNTNITATFIQEYTLTIVPEGSGTVAKSPDQATYHYGDLVTLLPTADPGWTFKGWGGDAAVSLDNKVTIQKDTNLTATFTQDEYTLSVLSTGSGSVALDPQQDTYNYGDVVTLIPTADPGWTFSGWGGDTAVPIDNKVTIQRDTNLTATFTQDEYLLIIVPEGSGTVDKSPDQATYNYNTEVTLIPTALPGWTFTGWGGDAAVSSDNKVIIQRDTNLTATFTQYEYTLTIVPEGSGTVDKSPDQSTFHYGEMVTLTANPAPDWAFVDWVGDATGNENPLVLTFDGDKTITARFEQTLFRYILVPIYK